MPATSWDISSKLASHHRGCMPGVPQVLSKSPLGPIRSGRTVSGMQQLHACQSPSGFAFPEQPAMLQLLLFGGLSQTVSAAPRSWPRPPLQTPHGCPWLQLVAASFPTSEAFPQVKLQSCHTQRCCALKSWLPSRSWLTKQQVFSQKLEGSKGKEDHYKGV